jgi:hypothetical protein
LILNLDSMTKFYIDDFKEEILLELLSKKAFGEHPEASLKDFTFYEFNLKDLGLPSAEELLNQVLEIKEKVSIKGWASKGIESKNYQGFSLSYNPNFYDSSASIYHQTWGSKQLTQTYSRKIDIGTHTQTKDTYYDTYAFRKIPPIVNQHLGYFLEKFNFSLLRSRVAFFEMKGLEPRLDAPWHIDEFPYQLLRINIPLLTSEEYVLDINGQDDFGNHLKIENKHLEVGKLYIWNTRIPHRITIKSKCISALPRIHMVLGFSPWLKYVDNDESFLYNQCHNLPLKEIVENKLFLKM